MQSVITWRRPADSLVYPPIGNPCATILGNVLCYMISGMILLVTGVIITSLTFQNLEHYKDGNRERYAGPVMIAIGIILLAKGACTKMRRANRSDLSRRRSFLRRYMREIYNTPIIAYRNSAMSLCDADRISFIEASERPRLYSDDPPPYDEVTSQEFTEREPLNLTFDAPDQVSDEVFDSPLDCASEAPPTYEEFMRYSSTVS